MHPPGYLRLLVLHTDPLISAQGGPHAYAERWGRAHGAGGCCCDGAKPWLTVTACWENLNFCILI